MRLGCGEEIFVWGNLEMAGVLRVVESEILKYRGFLRE
jgi:hypothetical protein